jgi:DNA-binding NarL/FixJ family response regulator
MLRLLLVEDPAMFFGGALAFALNRQPGMEIVAGCGSLVSCRALGGLSSVDVALLDLLVLPDEDRAEFVAVLRGTNPDMKVLVLSTSGETGLRERAAEADGVLAKSASPTEIAAEVGRLAVGGWF